jgi:hypothetical protein
MGLRFRRTWSVIPGVRFNLGLKSGSVSFGPRGLHYTVGTSGSRITAGLPGTGFFWTKKLNSPFSAAASRQGSQNQLPSAGGGPQLPHAQQSRAITPPMGAGAQLPQQGQPQTLSPFVTVAQSPQLRQPQGLSLPVGSTIQTSPSQNSAQLGGYPPSGTHPHFFVPLWLFWAVLAVIVIAGLCLISAVVGNLVR